MLVRGGEVSCRGSWHEHMWTRDMPPPTPVLSFLFLASAGNSSSQSSKGRHDMDSDLAVFPILLVAIVFVALIMCTACYKKETCGRAQQAATPAIAATPPAVLSARSVHSTSPSSDAPPRYDELFPNASKAPGDAELPSAIGDSRV